MSQFRKIVENILKEHNITLSEAKVIKVDLDELIQYDEYVKNLNIPYIKLYKNPTHLETISILNNSKKQELRGIIFNKDVYLWDAYITYHDNMFLIISKFYNDSLEYSVTHFTINKNMQLLLEAFGYTQNKTLKIKKELLLNTNLINIFSEKEILNSTVIHEASITEDTVKQGNSWINKGKDGTHGTFKTKKQADDQRKAMFANGYKG